MVNLTRQSKEPRLRHFQAMGGPCDLAVFDASDSLLDALVLEVARLEHKYSRYCQSSLLSQWNRAAGVVQQVDEESAGLLNYADHCYWLSDGAFDITSGVLRRAWDFHRQQLPDNATLESARATIGWHRVDWDGQSLGLEAGMELDFGGIVKEFAADRLVTLMREAGCTGMANLAGDIAVTGPKPSGEPWVLGIRDPVGRTGALANVAVNHGGLASSGDYERGFIIDGCRYSHILDPRTGWPVSEAPKSVSVVAELCIMAGTLATIAMLKGKEAESWLAQLGVPFLLCDAAMTVSGTLVTRAAAPSNTNTQG
jgi:thiamine biosynthesis lipoprotein